MIVDQLFENKHKTLNEIDPNNYDSDVDYYRALKGKTRPSDDDFDPPEDDNDYNDDEESYYEKSLRARGLGEDQLDEIDWKGWQDKMKAAGKGAKTFTKNVRDTGNAAAGMINAYGGAGKELGKQLIARPVGATYNAAKSGLNKAADVAKSTYGDVKKGAQNVGQAVDTVATDVGNAGTWAGNKIKQAGRGVANVAGGTAGAVGSTIGGATTGVGRAAAKGFNAGVKNVGGNAVNRLQTNVFKPKSDPVEIKKQIELKKQEIASLEKQLEPVTHQRQAYAGTNPATGKPWTADELMARMQPDATTAPTTTPANKMTWTAPMNKVPGWGTPAAPGAPASPKMSTSDYIKKIGAPQLPESKFVSKTLAEVNKMLAKVETKEDVQRIKQFVDQAFTKHVAVNESAFAVRNKMIEHVIRIGAQKRRLYSQNLAR